MKAYIHTWPMISYIAFDVPSLQAVRRTTSSLGCCINNFFEFVRRFFVALNTPGVRQANMDLQLLYSSCNIIYINIPCIYTYMQYIMPCMYGAVAKIVIVLTGSVFMWHSSQMVQTTDVQCIDFMYIGIDGYWAQKDYRSIYYGMHIQYASIFRC